MICVEHETEDYFSEELNCIVLQPSFREVRMRRGEVRSRMRLEGEGRGLDSTQVPAHIPCGELGKDGNDWIKA